MNKISLFWLAAALVAGSCPILPARAASPGLSVQDGVLVKAGQPYRGIGINYFDCFLRTLANGTNTSYDAGFKTLADYHIPFARFCATGFWPRDMKLYQADRAEYFRRLDGIVRSAEQHGVGLIPSLFWQEACVPDLVGEPVGEWANPKSKTCAWMREYVREVVTRYQDSPAIWAWEFGNEYSLAANLPNAKEHRAPVHPTLGTATNRTVRDELTYTMTRAMFAAFAKAVRAYDAHRLILTGDSFLRFSAWHQEHEGQWTHDTKAQFQEMLRKVNPDPINGIGVHAYEDDDQRLAWVMEVSRELKKPVFVGEFGAQNATPAQVAKFHRLLKAIADSGVPLAALWVFELKSQPDFTVVPGGARAYQLEALRDWNLAHAAQ